jgi:hypothetical protein
MLIGQLPKVYLNTMQECPLDLLIEIRNAHIQQLCYAGDIHGGLVL